MSAIAVGARARPGPVRRRSGAARSGSIAAPDRHPRRASSWPGRRRRAAHTRAGRPGNADVVGVEAGDRQQERAAAVAVLRHLLGLHRRRRRTAIPLSSRRPLFRIQQTRSRRPSSSASRGAEVPGRLERSDAVLRRSARAGVERADLAEVSADEARTRRRLGHRDAQPSQGMHERVASRTDRGALRRRPTCVPSGTPATSGIVDRGHPTESFERCREASPASPCPRPRRERQRHVRSRGRR